MAVAEAAISGISGLQTVFTDFISSAPQFIQFCLTTFPLNVGVGLGLAGSVVAFIRKMKPAGRA